MKLKNVLLVVEDVKKSSEFYKDLFNLHVVSDFGSKVIFSDGLVLQEKDAFEKELGTDISNGKLNFSLYFEENNLLDFLKKLSKYTEKELSEDAIQEDKYCRKYFRMLDPDGHLIELGENPDFTIRRLHSEGMCLEYISDKTKLPIDSLKGLYGLEDEK